MTRLRVFLDANTIVSGLLFPGNEAQLLDLGFIRALELVTTAYVMEEVQAVLGRGEFGLSEGERTDLLGYAQETILILPGPDARAVGRAARRLDDRKDAPVWAGFEATGASFLVTGDKELLRKVKGAVRTRELLDAAADGILRG